MENEFIPYELALALKELGFDEPCFGKWFIESKFLLPLFTKKEDIIPNNITILAPLYQQAFRWFRKKHGLYHHIGQGSKYATFNICDKNLNLWGNDNFNTWEKAELECLKKLIELCKK
tara:strand:+ start:12021 stop:12374 length:354 start_codon:yes stop_codon:yes gene_type:complete